MEAYSSDIYLLLEGYVYRLGLQIAADLAARIRARISFRQEGGDILTAVLDLRG